MPSSTSPYSSAFQPNPAHVRLLPNSLVNRLQLGAGNFLNRDFEDENMRTNQQLVRCAILIFKAIKSVMNFTTQQR